MEYIDVITRCDWNSTREDCDLQTNAIKAARAVCKTWVNGYALPEGRAISSTVIRRYMDLPETITREEAKALAESMSAAAGEPLCKIEYERGSKGVRYFPTRNDLVIYHIEWPHWTAIYSNCNGSVCRDPVALACCGY